MRNVLLVNANPATAPYPAPPVGLGLVAAAASGRHNVELFDGTFRPARDLARVIDEVRPDVIGVGIRNVDPMVTDDSRCFVDEILAGFGEALEGRGESAVLVLGGAGFSLFPRELMELFAADYGIVGEGEDAFVLLLESLDRGETPGAIPGLVARSGAGFEIHARPSRPAGELRLPFSRIDRLVDYAPYLERGAYPVQTKRGCPFQCVYCTYPVIEGGDVRLRPPAEVADELEEAASRLPAGVTFELVDSTFNSPPGHAEAVCREIAGRGLGLRLRTMGINPSGVTRELLELMKRAGFAQVDCTPDSASPAVIAAYRKNFSRGDLERAAELLREADMPAMWFFIFGGPGETEATLEESFDFIRRFVGPLDMVHMSEGMRICPGTALHEVAVGEGLVGPSESLLRPRFYVAPALGRERLRSRLVELSADLPNCVLSRESTPSPAMMKAALEERARGGLTEPMFRTLLRLRCRGLR